MLTEFTANVVLNLRLIINLQMAGEHASSGLRVMQCHLISRFGFVSRHKKIGFIYEPNDFMNHKILYYNFDWKDFSNMSMTSLLDMVMFVSFALQEGMVKIFFAKITIII